ncbi:MULTISPECIES: FAD-dependent monooxygenase [unclassified Aeromicrobium]|uniref:FAD-dependent monooxygenase n=1 Tax=unclassified Aeromicrobium TaxID=2633570 RepID=UPI00396AFC44
MLHFAFLSSYGGPMSHRVAVVGGGPGGLFLATLIRRQDPRTEVVLFERNQAEDAFGFGVVFSDATLRRIDEADPVLRDALASHGRHWDHIEVWSHGERHAFAGNGMAAIHRRVLLGLLQANARSVGVELRFGAVAPPVEVLQAEYDLVVGADGTNSAVRDFVVDAGHSVETARAKFIWFGTTHLFDGLTFVHRRSADGNFAVHGYPISDELSTFIVETDEQTWRRAGMDAFDVSQPPGLSDTDSQGYLENLFADDIGGASLVANNSRWGNFRTRRTRKWHHGNVVLLGDAVHTAHFSVGSGTKMAMEDAVTLAAQLHRAWSGETDLEGALQGYVAERSASVTRIQDSARPSLSWWEHFGSYQRNLEPLTFAFHFFSRSIGIEKIAQRDPRLSSSVRAAWEERHGAPVLESELAIGPSGERIGRLLHLDADGSMTDRAGRVVSPPLIDVPSTETGAAEAMAELPATGVVGIGGADEIRKTLVSEEARLRHGLSTILIGAYDDEQVETILLAGRADAIARPARRNGATDDDQ